MQDDEPIENPWNDPEAREVLRNYVRVVWGILERMEKEDAERRRLGLPELEPSDTVNEQQEA